jgi:small subunit ribosomal protein S15
VVGKKLVEFLEEKDAAPEIPEDLQRLLDKANSLVAHLNQHKKDRKQRHALENVEARIHRLSKYYKRIGKLPSAWRYKSVIAKIE